MAKITSINENLKKPCRRSAAHILERVGVVFFKWRLHGRFVFTCRQGPISGLKEAGRCGCAFLQGRKKMTNKAEGTGNLPPDKSLLDKLFNTQARGTSIKTECIAGLTSFTGHELSCSLLFQGMLADAGMPKRIKHCSRNLGHHFRNPAYGALGQVSSWSSPGTGHLGFFRLLHLRSGRL